MGQQQLLLLVLGIVIVGIAVVTGIESFEENQAKSEFDRYAQMGVELAAEIIAWYQKPAALGGAGEDPSKLATITISDLGYPLDAANTHAGKSRTATTANGVRRHVVQNGTVPYIHIHEIPTQAGMTRVEVFVFGPRPGCLVLRSDFWQESDTWTDGNSDDSSTPPNPDATQCTW
ncbi:MAG: hypothetical protein AAF624_12295 [Bacteroidota bacterium]